MKRLFLAQFLFAFLSASLCKAEMMAFNQAPKTSAMPGVVKQQDMKASQGLEVQGVSTSKISAGLEQEVNQPGQRSRAAFERISSSITDAKQKETLRSSLGSSPVDDKREFIKSISTISPDYRIKRGFLSLSKVDMDRHKRAFTFVFLMNSRSDLDKPSNFKNPSRMHMHILGHKKIFPEHEVIESKYPLDVSVARYEDGYAPGEWNLALPNKKPREVRVSLMWSF